MSRSGPRARPPPGVAPLTMMLGTPGKLGRLNLNCCTRISGRLNTSVPAKVARMPSRKPRTKLRLAGEGQRNEKVAQVKRG